MERIFGTEARRRACWALFGLALLCQAWPHAAFADAATDAIGKQVEADLRARYADTRMNCGTPTTPGLLCNGVIFRATVPSPDYSFWEPSPKSKASGGTSFSYLRADAKFKRLVRDENNGYIVFPPLATPADRERANVLCAFPEDGFTDTRSEQGCGPSRKEPGVSRLCHEQGIYTGKQWMEKHRKDKGSNIKQCAFNVRDAADEKATKSFEAFIDAMGLDVLDSFKQQNELRLATWSASDPATLPIEALFYLPGGLTDAQSDQRDYYERTGRFLPIIAMTLPQDRNKEATFNYLPRDQVVHSTTDAASTTGRSDYIESGTWTLRPDPGTGKEEWSLSIVPTPAGRDARADATDAVYAELVRKFGNDPRWKSNDGGGMRRQLVCHYVIARNKTPWNLEPFRPDVSEAEAEKHGCNPL